MTIRARLFPTTLELLRSAERAGNWVLAPSLATKLKGDSRLILILLLNRDWIAANRALVGDRCERTKTR